MQHTFHYRRWCALFLASLPVVLLGSCGSTHPADARQGPPAPVAPTPPTVPDQPAAPAAGQAIPLPTLDGHRLVLPDPIGFATGTSEVLPESEAAIAMVANYLEAKAAITLLRIEGHTDASGDAAANQALSEARALAVARALVARGVDCKRLLPVGFGSTKPIESEDTPAGKAANRRIEFVNAALRGIAIGGLPLDGGGTPAGDPCR